MTTSRIIWKLKAVPPTIHGDFQWRGMCKREGNIRATCCAIVYPETHAGDRFFTLRFLTLKHDDVHFSTAEKAKVYAEEQLSSPATGKILTGPDALDFAKSVAVDTEIASKPENQEALKDLLACIAQAEAIKTDQKPVLFKSNNSHNSGNERLRHQSRRKSGRTARNPICPRSGLCRTICPRRNRKSRLSPTSLFRRPTNDPGFSTLNR